MSDLIASNPDDSRPARKKKAAASKRKRADEHQQRTENAKKRRRAIYSEEDCLDGLSRIPGLVAMGVLKTAQANSIRGVYSTILGHHQKAKGARAEQVFENDDLRAVLRKNPEMISMLEPLLTDEQINMLMNDARDGDDEET